MGFSEILLIMAIALILFGPEDLPDIARTIGKIVFEIRNATHELTKEFQNSLDTPTSSRKNEQETQAPQSGVEVPATKEVLLKYEDESFDDPLAKLPSDMVSYEEKDASR